MVKIEISAGNGTEFFLLTEASDLGLIHLNRVPLPGERTNINLLPVQETSVADPYSFLTDPDLGSEVEYGNGSGSRSY